MPGKAENPKPVASLRSGAAVQTGGRELAARGRARRQKNPLSGHRAPLKIRYFSKFTAHLARCTVQVTKEQEGSNERHLSKSGQTGSRWRLPGPGTASGHAPAPRSGWLPAAASADQGEEFDVDFIDGHLPRGQCARDR
jgi:hypothetical protein